MTEPQALLMLVTRTPGSCIVAVSVCGGFWKITLELPPRNGLDANDDVTVFSAVSAS